MHNNQQLITGFYTAFSRKDYAAMQACYAADATFSDEVFMNLNAKEVRAMWEMLCLNGKDLHIAFSHVEADETQGSAQWVATYTFSQTSKKVTNHIQAHFTFSEGKILTHCDRFSFYRWASQALGWPGKLLGWTSWMQRKVQTSARVSLAAFMNRHA